MTGAAMFPDEAGWVTDHRDPFDGPAPQTRRFDLIPFGDITYNTDQRWLVKGLMSASGLATIFGRKKEYKSFVALDLATHIALGRPWAGRRVRQGAVVYIVGEGASGFCDRVAANREKFGLPDDLPFRLIKARPNLGAAEGDREALIASIEPALEEMGQPLAAIFIDTLARMLAGSNENDEGMRNFTDNSEAIAEHFDCLAVAVHHIGKDDTRGMRGSSALPAAVVTSWKVEKVKPFQARVTVDDAKDGPSGLTWLVDLERYVFGQDEDGDDMDVLLVAGITEPTASDERLESRAEKSERLPPQLRLVMSCLANVMASAKPARPFPDGPAVEVVPLDLLRAEYFTRRGDDASEDAKRKSFQNSIKSGLDQRIINAAEVAGQRVIWPTKTT